MRIEIVQMPMTKVGVKELAKDCYETMVKGVADVRRGIIALGGEWHMDANARLIAQGSKQSDLWGFNYYPDEDRIVYTALINIRPAQSNRSMEVQSPDIRKKMQEIIHSLIV